MYLYTVDSTTCAYQLKIFPSSGRRLALVFHPDKNKGQNEEEAWRARRAPSWRYWAVGWVVHQLFTIDASIFLVLWLNMKGR